MSFEENIAARTAIVGDLRRFMVGPLDECERIWERASDRYHTGFLYPAGTPVDPEEDDIDKGEDEPGTDTGSGENILALANLKQQSAVGMTFQVRGPDAAVSLFVSWALYVQELAANLHTNENDTQMRSSDEKGKDTGTASTLEAQPPSDEYIWAHKPFSKTIVIPPHMPTTEGISVKLMDFEGIQVLVTSRLKNQIRILTISLVNRKPPTSEAGQASDEPKKDNNIYQVFMKAYSPSGEALFVSRPPSSYILDEELWNHELLYSEVCQFAVGHGCSVYWTLANDPWHANEVSIQWIPETEVFKASASVMEGDPILSLEALAQLENRRAVCNALRRLTQRYSEWINEQRKDLNNIVPRFSEAHKAKVATAATRNLELCTEARDRIGEGIRLLEKDEKVWRSFCLANQAMSKSMRQARKDVEPVWRAFQLAFFVLTLPSVAVHDHKYRKVLDLIWFPTGGGKTEAYLGLAAFSMFYRRISALKPSDGFGTAVLTRYTLRLLTIQQFGRAARVICACELLRRESPEILGKEEFSIGLFVGKAGTPNTIEQASDFLKGEGTEDGSTTTLPLVKCPWCDNRITMDNQKIEENRLITWCPKKDCAFHTRIPIIVVDEEIYAHPPTMVIGTVDKFALMPWEPKIRVLFGKGSAQVSPPSLIIQDELHLIGDALGTITALYETAIDYLCSQDGIPPKIVGSTATIRRAEEQSRGLFARNVLQFPPSGVSHSTSFFYAETREVPGRLYVGLHAQGRSPKHTLARLIGTLSQSAKQISDPLIRDHYYTMVAYFNSLRELGGALVLAEDDVPRYIDSMVLPAGVTRRTLVQIKELTSQVPSSEIPEILTSLETSIPELSDDIDREPVDLLLSTNMISVGVDVDRLGLMIINGQPKTTAEYIQASSRIGRPPGTAGLVVTLYNWTRPRDRSHYERFTAYHQAFYRHVESTSVTPFSARARDRALHAVLFTLVRLTIEQMIDNGSAGQICTSENLQGLVKELQKVIVDRALNTDASEADETKKHLELIYNDWYTVAENRRLLWRRAQNIYGLMRPADDIEAHGKFPTLQSMRDVEPSSNILLLSNDELNKIAG